MTLYFETKPATTVAPARIDYNLWFTAPTAFLRLEAFHTFICKNFYGFTPDCDVIHGYCMFHKWMRQLIDDARAESDHKWIDHCEDILRIAYERMRNEAAAA